MRTLIEFASHAELLISVIPMNVSGVVFSFAKWMTFCCDQGMDTAARNEHPITKAYIIGLESIYGPFSVFNDTVYSDTLKSLKALHNHQENV